MDLIDELIDRFGDPPDAVKGLVDVALVRNTASQMGIREISQRGDAVLLYPEVMDMSRAGSPRRQAARPRDGQRGQQALHHRQDPRGFRTARHHPRGARRHGGVIFCNGPHKRRGAEQDKTGWKPFPEPCGISSGLFGGGVV